MGEFRMPSLGADMDVGTIVEWLVKPGDAVHRGQIVAVVDTAKAAIEIEAFEEGVLEEILIGVGVQVPVGTPLAVIGTSDLAGAEPPARAGAGGRGQGRGRGRGRGRGQGRGGCARRRRNAGRGAPGRRRGRGGGGCACGRECSAPGRACYSGASTSHAADPPPGPPTGSRPRRGRRIRPRRPNHPRRPPPRRPLSQLAAGSRTLRRPKPGSTTGFAPETCRKSPRGGEVACLAAGTAARC